jgi:hypothetical protein
METIGGLQGFVDIKTVNKETGEVTQHIREYNTLTLGALASIFARGMFEKPSCYRCEAPMANVHFGDKNNGSWKPEGESYYYYEYSPGYWTNRDAQYAQRDSRGINNGLAGIGYNDAKCALFSAFAPNSFGVYLLRNLISIDKYTQVPPYAADLCSVLSSDVVGYSQGVVMEESNEAELSQQMYGSSEGSFFNPAHLIHARQLVRHSGVFTIRSIAWGSAVSDACCWGVRARIKGFEEAGYSHFYVIEHRLVDGEPQTILWQDNKSAGWYNGSNITRDILGFNITTGKTLNQKIPLASKPSNWMGAFMQGVVIGDSVFSVSQSGTTITVNRYDNWKYSDNVVSATKSITLTASSSGTVVSGAQAVALHNLATGKLEVFTTVAKLSDNYEVRRIVIEPDTLNTVESSCFLPYLITQTLPSVSGTVTGQNDKNSGGQTRSSTFIGFLDYTSKTETTDGVYHLPFSKFINDAEQEITVNDFPSATAWMYGYRVGVRFSIDKVTGDVALGSEFIVCGLYSFALQHQDIDDNVAWYARDNNYRTCNHDRVLQWGYTKTVFSNTVLPVQMMPVTGPYTTTYFDQQWAIGKNPFSLMVVSRVMCGLNLKSPIFKSEEDSLYVTYGWQLKVSDT